MKKTIVLAAVAASIAGGAYAGAAEPVAVVEAVVVAEPAAEVADWSGFYAGVVAGTVLGTNTWYWDDGFDTGHTLPGDWSGTPVGITLGFNHQLSNGFVVGIEGDYSSGDIIAINDPNIGVFGCAGGTCETDLQNFASIRGRAGYVTGNMMVFGTVGYGFADALGTDQIAINGEGPVSGLVWGGGVEFALSSAWTAKAEYLDVDLGTLELPVACGGPCYTDIGFQAIRVGINRQF